jgi:hypothetical protein
MGSLRLPDPALLVIAVFSRHEGAMDWARAQLEKLFGPIGLTSPAYDFIQTTYYETTMGAKLRKQFFVFRELVSADSLPAIKLHTNDLESELAGSGSYPEPRPLNLDPGLLTLGKFMLATTKDQAHRIYLREGIFAEVTLRYQAGAFESWPWTYADYRQDVVRAFLQEAREFYRQIRQRRHNPETPAG